MLYMVELHYSREQRDAALGYFWEHCLTGYENKVTVKGACVATQDLIASALVDAADPDEMTKACVPREQFGEVSHRHVTSADQI